jgi:hypothetical protein
MVFFFSNNYITDEKNVYCDIRDECNFNQKKEKRKEMSMTQCNLSIF